MATILRFGDLLFVNLLTEDFTQEAVRDHSNTDLWVHRYTYTVSSVLNLDTFNTVGRVPPLGVTSVSDKTVSTLAECSRYVSKQLTDRQTWALSIDTDEGVSNIDNVGGTQDIDTGPKVLWKKLTKITDTTMLVRFCFQASVCPCADSQNKPPAVIGNRWSQQDDYDEMARCHRVWRGILRVSGDRVNPQTFRNTILPPLSDGFRRKRMHFNVAPNGLELEYTIEDEELGGDAPPRGASRMSLTHSERFGTSGESSTGDLSVRLDAARGVSKQVLLQQAMAIAANKLSINSQTQTTTTVMECVVVNHASDNENAVEVNIRVKHTKATGNPQNQTNPQFEYLGTIQTNILTTGLDPSWFGGDYNVDQVTYTDGYGNSGLAGALACALQTPCSGHDFGSTRVDPGTGNSQDVPREDLRVPYTVQTSPVSLQLDFSPPSYSEDHLDAPYSWSKIDLYYEQTYNRLQLPIATSGNQQESTGSQGVDSLLNGGNGATSVVVTLAPPTCRLRVLVQMERIGQPPKIWEARDFSANGVNFALLSHTPNTRPPLPMGNKTDSIYSIDAEYLFAADRPFQPGQGLPASSLPWTQTTVSDDAYPSSAFISPTDYSAGIV